MLKSLFTDLTNRIKATFVANCDTNLPTPGTSGNSDGKDVTVRELGRSRDGSDSRLAPASNSRDGQRDLLSGLVERALEKIQGGSKNADSTLSTSADMTAVGGRLGEGSSKHSLGVTVHADTERSSLPSDDTYKGPETENVSLVVGDKPWRKLSEDEVSRMEADIIDCENKKRNALASRRVQFMLHNLKTVGCPVPDPVKLLQCTPCDVPLAAAVVTEAQTGRSNLVICQNLRLPQSMINHAVTHELIHIYDMCRAHVKTCDDMACLEVRAPMLSGECQFSQEFMRGTVGIFDFKNHLKKCVRRRALRSLEYNSVCKDLNECNASLDRVFDRCFADRAPFYTIPHED